jgi:hypothetical protein
MYQFCEQYTYFGSEHETRGAATRALVPGGFTGFADWAKVHEGDADTQRCIFTLWKNCYGMKSGTSATPTSIYGRAMTI